MELGALGNKGGKKKGKKKKRRGGVVIRRREWGGAGKVENVKGEGRECECIEGRKEMEGFVSSPR